jgi:hypothetical protein
MTKMETLQKGNDMTVKTIKGLTILTLAASSAFAQEKKDDKPIVTPYGSISFNTNFLDTSRSNVIDFSAEHARLGLKVQHGFVDADLLVQFIGNREKNANTVSIRKAALGLNLPKFNLADINFATKISVGGLRISGAENTAPSVANVTNGFGRQDGIYLNETITFANQSQIKLGLGLFNNINAKKMNEVSTLEADWSDADNSVIASDWSNKSNSESKGFLAKAEVKTVVTETAFFQFTGVYALQDNALSKKNKDTIKARDVKHLEASILFNDTNVFGDKAIIAGNGIAAFYENVSLSKEIKAEDMGGNKFKYDSVGAFDNSQKFQLIGISVGGDTESYLTNIMTTNDRITYAAAYSLANVNFANSKTNLGLDNPDYKIHQGTAYIGYGLNGFETGLNFAYSKASEKIYTNREGKADKDNKFTGTLIAQYKF